MKIGKAKRSWIIFTIAVLICVVILACIITKVIKVNPLWANQYPVRGVDVSHYQGDIDWQVLHSQGIDFAYIKATEGSSSTDDKFEENWKEAAATTMKVGAYHFFSFDSAGKTQAENYIRTVGTLDGKLVPVVDVEYYGDKAANPPDKEAVIVELTDLLYLLEQEYGVKPMIYTTYKVYYKYLEGVFEEYPLWIRDVYLTPDITLNDKWTLWQYSDTDVLDGYSGIEKYIDRNVFVGSAEDLKELMILAE